MDAIDFIIDNGDMWLQYATRKNILNESKDDLADVFCNLKM